MIEGTRYVHTNLVARDWQPLARFYETHLGCVRVPPERDYSVPNWKLAPAFQTRRCEEYTCACPAMEKKARRWKSSVTRGWPTGRCRRSTARASVISPSKW